jgi:serine protease Do
MAKTPERSQSRIPVATLAIVLAATGAGFGASHWLDEVDMLSQARAAPAEAPAAPARAMQMLPDFATLVEQNGGAVVNITTVQKAQRGGNQDPRLELLRRFGIPVPVPDPDQAQPARGLGSGFILSSDGYILTNAHVVADAAEVTVRLTDRREFAAKVVGVDRHTDVAVLKIQARDLPTAKVGDPERVRVGDWVAAIGSPFGFENSVTAGIVSAKSRALPDESLVPFIQTDVAVNPGNSGGPLFNLNGEVVGINSQIYSRTGGFMGLSFAIPIDLAINVAEQIKQHGYARHARLGISIQPVSRELADTFGLDRPRGALINGVENGTPAEKAGLRPGDVVLSIDDLAVNDAFDLPKQVGNMSPGKRIRLGVWRDKKRMEVAATLGEQPRQREPTEEDEAAQGGLGMGLGVRALTEAEARQLGVKGGLLIAEVSGPAARAGLQPGDAILSANGKPVDTVKALADIVKQGDGKVALLVQRGQNRLFVPLKAG